SCMRRVADILEKEKASRLAVVLSACRGVTDDLLNLVTSAERQEPFSANVDSIRQRHREIAVALCSEAEATEYMVEVERECNDIPSILHAVQLMRSGPPAVRDLIAGFGEIWSTRLFTRYLKSRGHYNGSVVWVDAREIVQADWTALGPNVLWKES